MLLIVALGRTSYLASVSLINYIFNEGTLVVPDLTGVKFSEAARILQPYDLEVSRSGTQYHHFLREGEIISQDPYGNTKVKKGRVIKVIVSGGQEIVRVPDVRGRLLAEAEALLRNTGTNVSDRCYIPDEEIPADHIITTDPQPASRAVRNEPVALLVSSGREKRPVLLGDVTGLTLARARENFPDLRIQPRYEYSPDREQSLIYSQNPPSGTLMEWGGMLEVWVNESAIPVKGGRRYETIVFDVPAGRNERLLRFILTDDQGIREVFRQEVEAGQKINYTVGGIGRMRVMVYLDNTLVKELQYD
ncbi:MAG: PASTA domain-containing protein [Candidatus Wallbacteria bacterium]|nr:PASTA domain-containing protein [Candidatus Wallbacteria bacterium]